MNPITVLAVVALVAVAVLVFSKLRRRNSFGFKDFLKNPGLDFGLAAINQEREEAVAAAKSWPDGRVAKEVDRVLFRCKSKDDVDPTARALEALGPKVHRLVLQILSDKKFRSKLVKPTGKDLVHEAPFNRACDLLGTAPPPEAAAAVIPFLDEPSGHIRADVAMVLGKIGTPEIIVPLRRALRDPEEHVCASGLTGLKWAIKNQSLSKACREELFEDLLALLSNLYNAGRAAELLLEFDSQRATELFLSEAYFAPESKYRHHVLRALAKHQIRVPRNKLLGIISEADLENLDRSKSYQIAAALKLLGLHQNVEDLATLDRLLSHPDERVSEGAAEGFLAAHGMEGFRDRFLKLSKNGGVGVLNEAQQYWLAVVKLDGEVCNGGLSQYFVNSSGDDWKTALRGLEATGMAERAAILREAAAIFGPDGPSESRGRRREQLSKIIRADEDRFDSLDASYFASKEGVRGALTKYVVQNREKFE